MPRKYSLKFHGNVGLPTIPAWKAALPGSSMKLLWGEKLILLSVIGFFGYFLIKFFYNMKINENKDKEKDKGEDEDYYKKFKNLNKCLKLGDNIFCTN
tara:strand:+ start:590 stop:883 length:294 start_codon:yes stop_codon:yes gene_type:complete